MKQHSWYLSLSPVPEETKVKIVEVDPTITKVTRVIAQEPKVTTVVVEGEPVITKVTRVIGGDHDLVTKVSSVSEVEPSITKVTRVIEGQPTITKITRVIEGQSQSTKYKQPTNYGLYGRWTMDDNPLLSVSCRR